MHLYTDQADPVYPVHSLDALRSDTLHDIDHAHKEKHLSRDEFVTTLGMRPEEFDLLPEAEQARRKADMGLI